MKNLKKYLALFFIILLTASVSFGNEIEEKQIMKNIEDFENQIIELSKQISQTTKYDYQDEEFVENEMDGDETVYERAWKGDGYFLIRNYEDDKWSENKSWIRRFTLRENSSFNLKGEIKIGSSLNKLKKFFGDTLQKIDSDVYYSGDFYFYIDGSKQCVKSIEYGLRGYITSKMLLLDSLYNDDL